MLPSVSFVRLKKTRKHKTIIFSFGVGRTNRPFVYEKGRAFLIGVASASSVRDNSNNLNYHAVNKNSRPSYIYRNHKDKIIENEEICI